MPLRMDITLATRAPRLSFEDELCCIYSVCIQQLRQFQRALSTTGILVFLPFQLSHSLSAQRLSALSGHRYARPCYSINFGRRSPNARRRPERLVAYLPNRKPGLLAEPKRPEPESVWPTATTRALEVIISPGPSLPEPNRSAELKSSDRQARFCTYSAARRCRQRRCSCQPLCCQSSSRSRPS